MKTLYNPTLTRTTQKKPALQVNFTKVLEAQSPPKLL